ncbi:hypothetical protein SAMN05216293_2356 [Flagellimonas taeanensis]|jgi:hypothetical protein|uniref:Uncharacterized protein n=1 Tax=Flagellimonas taeanensis TaxID=1005926 RepID=A0A1M6WXV0_9FLAO|nr:hypothetical protein SAMN05216293_2356 [Allomuricauda taeanensis]
MTVQSIYFLKKEYYCCLDNKAFNSKEINKNGQKELGGH